jgi:hypothetical protein
VADLTDYWDSDGNGGMLMRLFNAGASVFVLPTRVAGG